MQRVRKFIGDYAVVLICIVFTFGLFADHIRAWWNGRHTTAILQAFQSSGELGLVPAVGPHDEIYVSTRDPWSSYKLLVAEMSDGTIHTYSIGEHESGASAQLRWQFEFLWSTAADGTHITNAPASTKPVAPTGHSSLP